MAQVLVIQGESAGTSGVLSELLVKLGQKVLEVQTVTEAVAQTSCHEVEIIFVEAEAEAAVKSLSAIKAEAKIAYIPVVILASFARSSDVIEAMKLGAFEHLSKPLQIGELEAVIKQALARPNRDLNLTLSADSLESDFLIGLSPPMRKLEKLIGIAAGCDATVLIQGETGSGKDTIARAIHKHSRHKGEPLTVIDCTAVPEDYDYFESLSPGAQGSVLLDEVGDLNGNTQAMLVRALKEAAADSKLPSPRIIATTQYDLIRMVREKGFREDLYYRLNVLPLSIPPLRERGSDILALAETFLQQARSEKRLSSAAAKLLLDNPWPGNVRQLQNLMYHLAVAVRSAVIDDCDLSMLEAQGEPDHLPGDQQEESNNSSSGNSQKTKEQAIDYYGTIASVEKKLLTDALKKAGGSRSEAARLLGINRQLLYAKLKSHGLMGE